MLKKSLLLAILMFSFLYPQVKISGDARIRPRYDVNDRTPSKGNKTEDFYYMYRARIKVSADIDEGWMFNAMLAHNGISDYSIFAAGDYPDISGVNQSTTKPTTNENSRRATVSFMELYFGKEVEKYGFRMGLFPLGAMNNPVYDIHYYPTKMVDIPFYVNNSDGAYGIAGYLKTDIGKFGAKVLVEDAKGKYEENSSGKSLYDIKDQYTVELNYTAEAGGFVIAPMAMISISDDSVAAPNTFGINLTSPKFSGLTLSATGAYSIQSRTDLRTTQEPGYPVCKYNAYLMRLKLSGPLGPGNLVAWFDYGHMTQKLPTVDDKYDFYFTWVGYEIPIYKSQKGSFSITPEIRYAKIDKNSSSYSKRIKSEINFDIKF
jgi:hypothetical protein